jgi:hypothetical protein
MAVGDVYRLGVVSSFTGFDQMVNVFHYEQLADGAFPGAQELCLQWEADALPAYLDLLSTRITVQILEARQVLGGAESFDLGIGVNGELSSDDIVPLTSAPIISWRTGLAGRSFRGRTYLPPVPEGNQDAGNLDSAYSDLMDAFAAANRLLINGVTEEFQLVVFSTVEDGSPRVPPIATPVTSWVVRDNMGSQRRRRQGVGS